MSSNPITLQQVFDKAWQAFIVEDKPPCVTETGTCVYRNKETGERCAIGLCLTDEQIDELCDTDIQLLRENVYIIASRFPAWFDLTPTPVALLHRTALGFFNLQRRLHDGLERIRYEEPGPRRWTWVDSLNVRKRIYRDFAAEYGLTIPGESNEQPDNASASV